MKTAVIMKRRLWGYEISQNSKTGFFSQTDLVAAGNHWRTLSNLPPFDPKEWFRRTSSKEFTTALESKYGNVRTIARGRGQHTWVHPLLFLDVALAISPKLKIEVYEWVNDGLLQIRNDSGDSYKRMCSVLLAMTEDKTQFVDLVADVAIMIRQACGVKDWQRASLEELKMRDKCHDNIALSVKLLKSIDNGVREGLSATIEAFGKTAICN